MDAKQERKENYMEKHITAPIDQQTAKELTAGDYVYITGTIYVARDAAHQRIYEAMNANKEIAIPLENNIIYYKHKESKIPYHVGIY